MEVIRRATQSDAAAVRDLTRAAYSKWTSIIGREPKPMQADYAEAIQHHLVDLLFADGELAGLIETVPEPTLLLIKNVAVSPAHQGRGFGRRLMTHAEQLARSVNLPGLRLYTNKAFAENIRLYLGLGYAIDREEAISDGALVHMSKSLRRVE